MPPATLSQPWITADGRKASSEWPPLAGSAGPRPKRPGNGGAPWGNFATVARRGFLKPGGPVLHLGTGKGFSRTASRHPERNPIVSAQGQNYNERQGIPAGLPGPFHKPTGLM